MGTTRREEDVAAFMVAAQPAWLTVMAAKSTSDGDAATAFTYGSLDKASATTFSTPGTWQMSPVNSAT